MCYGCGERGHGMNACPRLNELIVKRTIKRDVNGRYTMADGSRIPRNMNEPLIHAVRRLQPGHTNYVALAAQAVTDDEVSDYDSDFEDTYNYAFPAEYAPKSTKEARKERFEGVFPPPRPAWAKRTDPDKPSIKPSEVHKPNQVPIQSKPVEIHKPTFNPLNDEDIVMKDATYRTARKTPLNKSTDDKAENHVRKLPIQSELTKQAKPDQILDRILKTPLTMSVGEVIGTSRDISHQLQELMRGKRPTPTSKVEFISAYMNSDSKQPLVRTEVRCEGKPILAVIDTGSEMNVASEEVWKNCMTNLILDKSITPKLVAANGSVTTVLGVVHKAPLICGGALATPTDIFILKDPPFQLLLGRPWQCSSLVTIDERADGTYLLFKGEGIKPDLELKADTSFPRPHESYFTSTHSPLPSTTPSLEMSAFFFRDQDLPLAAPGEQHYVGGLLEQTIYPGPFGFYNGSQYEDWYVPTATFAASVSDADGTHRHSFARYGQAYIQFYPTAHLNEGAVHDVTIPDARRLSQAPASSCPGTPSSLPPLIPLSPSPPPDLPPAASLPQPPPIPSSPASNPPLLSRQDATAIPGPAVAERD